MAGLDDEALDGDAFALGSCAYLTWGSFAAGTFGCVVALRVPVLTGTGTCATNRWLG